MWARVACFILGIGIGAQGCEARSCTDAGCASGVSIAVGSAQPLPTGLYTVTVLLDGVATTCRRTLPETNDPTTPCDSRDMTFYFGESFAALPPGSVISDLYIEISGTPRRIELEIAHDESVVSSESFTPEYVTHAPNGEDCPPVCQNADLEAAPLLFE